MNPGGITPFSRDFAAALRSVMTQRGVRQAALAAHLGRSTGFVSEHLSGKRPVDTDMLDAIAEVAEIDTRQLVVEVSRRMEEAAPRKAGRKPRPDAVAIADAAYSEGSAETPRDGDERHTISRGRKP